MINLFRKKKAKINKNEPDFIFNNHRFYVLNPYADEASPRKLSVQRALDFALALNNLSLFLNREEIVQFANKITELAMDKQNAEIITMAGLLKARIELKADADLYIDMGKAIILVDDEPNEMPTNEYFSLKNELLKHSSVSGFFLRTGLSCMVNIDPLLQITQAEDYLQSQEAKEITSIWKSYLTT